MPTEALAQNRPDLQKLVDSISVPAVARGLSPDPPVMNSPFLALAGLTVDVAPSCPSDGEEGLLDHLLKVIARNRDKLIFGYAFTIDGKERNLIVANVPLAAGRCYACHIVLEQGHGILGSSIDSHLLGERLRGVMGLTLLHAIKNTLGALQFFFRDLKSGTPALDLLEVVDPILLSISSSMGMLNQFASGLKAERTAEMLRLDAVSVRSLVDRVLGISRPLARHKRLKLESKIDGEVPDALYTDGTRLYNILCNLVDNAVKYTADGKVKLSVYVRDSSKSIVFKVKDTGIGIPREHLERIFDEFQRVNQAHEPSGYGCGLAVARALAGMMGASLSVRSKPGKGSSFYLEIPLAMVAEGEHGQ